MFIYSICMAKIVWTETVTSPLPFVAFFKTQQPWQKIPACLVLINDEIQTLPAIFQIELKITHTR